MKEFMKAVPIEKAIGKKLIGYCESEHSDEYLLLLFEDETFCQLKAEKNDEEWEPEIVNDLSICPSCYRKGDLIELGIEENLIAQWYADQEDQRRQEQKESRRKLFKKLKQEFEA